MSKSVDPDETAHYKPSSGSTLFAKAYIIAYGNKTCAKAVLSPYRFVGFVMTIPENIKSP